MSTVYHVPILGSRLPWSFHQKAGGNAPANENESNGNASGKLIAWNWNVPHDYYNLSIVPGWLYGLFPSAEYSVTHWYISTIDHAVSKRRPLKIMNANPDVLVDHAWVRLDLKRQYPTTRGFVIAELEFYESAEAGTPGYARLQVTAKTPGAAGNAITTTETLGQGSWATPTLTGGLDAIHNVSAGETVEINGLVYTFVASPSSARDVLLGVTWFESLSNLVAAINDTGVEGTNYGTGTVVHPTVSAALGATDGTVVITSKLVGDFGNGISVAETLEFGAWDSATMANGVTARYLANPGFSFSSIVSAIQSGSQGLEIQTSSDVAEILLPDLRFGLWDRADSLISVVNWEHPEHGTINVFGGSLGRIVYDNTGFVTMSIDGKMTRKRQWPAEVWSPTCRADLGDYRCRFDIESLSRTFTITSVVSQVEIRTNELSNNDDYYTGGVCQALSGPNAGNSVEVVSSKSTNSTGGDPDPAKLIRARAKVELKTLRPIGAVGSILPMVLRLNINPGEVIVVDGKTYTFQNSLTNVDGHVKIGNTQRATLSNFRAAINAGAGAGSVYAAATTEHTTVRAGTVSHDGDSLRLNAKVPGTGGNSFTLTTNSANVNLDRFHGGAGTPEGGDVDDTAFDTIKFSQAFPFPLAPGDEMKIWPGCDKKFSTCRDRFHNTLNFRGEPFWPAPDGLKVA